MNPLFGAKVTSNLKNHNDKLQHLIDLENQDFRQIIQQKLNLEGEINVSKRKDGFLVVHDGINMIFENGILHSLKEPAWVKGNHKKWYKQGVLHREGGPAIEAEDFTRWYFEGKIHREDGPAYETTNQEFTAWYQQGQLHRTDGPAFVKPGRKEWKQKGQYHRLDGPALEAVIRGQECESWSVNGRLHRTDGPAVKDPEGTLMWYQNGVLHREDGPAVEGAKERYFIKGEELNRKQFKKRMSR